MLKQRCHSTNDQPCEHPIYTHVDGVPICLACSSRLTVALSAAATVSARTHTEQDHEPVPSYWAI
jgi:hypothetical protein